MSFLSAAQDLPPAFGAVCGNKFSHGAPSSPPAQEYLFAGIALRRSSCARYVSRVPQNLSRKLPGYFFAFTDYPPVDNGIVHANRALDQPFGPSRIIVGPLGFTCIDRLGIEDRQVGGVSGFD